jgi:single-strand DNA-binding protein
MYTKEKGEKMARSINKVVLLGHLGKEVETKFTPSGKTIAKFSLATTSQIKDSSGDWVDVVEWHSIIVWEKLAELAAKYLVKGSKVYIEGRIQTNSWEDKQSGEKKYRTEIVASDIIFLDSKGDNKSNTNQSSEITDEDDSIPF